MTFFAKNIQFLTNLLKLIIIKLKYFIVFSFSIDELELDKPYRPDIDDDILPKGKMNYIT